MNRASKLIFVALIAGLLCVALSCPALAVTEEEVQAQVDAVGKEAVTGNLFIWLLCAMAFLKASMKIDSFMQALGISVGRTGGNMLAEAMITARGVGMGKGGFAGFFGGGQHSPGSPGGSAAGSAAGGGSGGGFFSGGLSGMVGRHFTNSAIRSVTGQQSGGAPGGSAPSAGGGAPTGSTGGPGGGGSPSTGQSSGGGMGSAEAGAPAFEYGEPSGGSDEDGPVLIPPQSDEDTGTEGGGVEGMASEGVGVPEGSRQTQTQQMSQPPAGGGLGRRLFEGSMTKGGGFATRVISSVALGSIAATGTMTGPTAAAALSSYLGFGSGGGNSGATRPSGTVRHSGSGHRDGTGTVTPGGISAPTSPQTIPAGSVDGPMGGAQLGGTTTEGPSGIPAAGGPQIPDASAPAPIPAFSHVEIGGGRITGVETAPGASEGMRFALYSAEQYMEPDGAYTPITTRDGAKWYKQYAKDVVDKQPYKEDGEIKYHESIVKRMPPMPRRKDRA